jgi:hypothetical protein
MGYVLGVAWSSLSGTFSYLDLIWRVSGLDKDGETGGCPQLLQLDDCWS